MEYALADLARVTGAKRRSLQLWADAGVITADSLTDRAGTGTHRRFSRDEAIIACVIHAFALRQIAIGELIMISREIRKTLSSPLFKKMIFDTAIKGGENCFLVYERWKDKCRVHPFVGVATFQQEFHHLDKPEAFAAVINLRTYLAGLNE